MRYNTIKSTFLLSILILFACEQEPTNPTLKDTDLSVFFWGKGGTVSGEAWEGYDVFIGDSLETKLMVSPSEGTSVSWELEDGTILSNTTSYSYFPIQEETQRTRFIATLTSGYADTITFNFRGVLDGYTSIINQWQSVLIPQGTQTGKFILEFDMTPSKDTVDAIVGVAPSVTTEYSQLSTIIRFNNRGTIDAYDNNKYKADNDVAYKAGEVFHVTMNINASSMTYSVDVSTEGNPSIEIANDYKFLNKSTELNYWSIVANDFLLPDAGTHQVSNMTITTICQNTSPVIMEIEDIEIAEGETHIVQIETIDPLGDINTLEAFNLPRFATFIDEGNGNAIIELKPYNNCGGCDLGEFNIKVVATNLENSDSSTILINVYDPSDSINIIASKDDGTIWQNGAITTDYKHLFGGRVDAGEGGEDDVVAIVPFALPQYNEGKRVATASLALVTTDNNAWVDVKYDLYALSSRIASTLLPSDFYIGTYNEDANATAIQEGIITNDGFIGLVTTNEIAEIDLADFINTQYEAGAVEGDYIFLRINANRTMPIWAHLQFKSAESDIAETEPTLTLTFENAQ